MGALVYVVIGQKEATTTTPMIWFSMLKLSYFLHLRIHFKSFNNFENKQ